jgi:hypothetical protein
VLVGEGGGSTGEGTVPVGDGGGEDSEGTVPVDESGSAAVLVYVNENIVLGEAAVHFSARSPES